MKPNLEFFQEEKPSSLSSHQHYRSAANMSTANPDGNDGKADQFARWLEKKEMEQDNKYNRTVTISHLS